MSEYKFGTVGKKTITIDENELSINNKVIKVEDIKCVYITPASLSKNGIVYFSTDGKDINLLNKQLFVYTTKQKPQVDELLESLGLEVKQSMHSAGMGTVNKEKQYEKDRVAQLKRDKVPFCPKCKSTSITYVDKKLSIGRAITGGLIAGETGAKLGGFTSKKGKLKCLNCGKEWKI